MKRPELSEVPSPSASAKTSGDLSLPRVCASTCWSAGSPCGLSSRGEGVRGKPFAFSLSTVSRHRDAGDRLQIADTPALNPEISDMFVWGESHRGAAPSLTPSREGVRREPAFAGDGGLGRLVRTMSAGSAVYGVSDFPVPSPITRNSQSLAHTQQAE